MIKTPALPANTNNDDQGVLWFRILKRGSWKAAFRLERAFWQVLEEAAIANNMKLADYVKEIIENSSEKSANNSSELRVKAVEFLVAQYESIRASSSLKNRISTALAAPAPCFVLDSSRNLVGHNQEFYEFVAAAARQQGDGKVSAIHLTLDVPVKKLMERLAEKETGALVCGYAIRTASQEVLRGNARVALTLGQEFPALVGYLLETHISRPESPAS